MMIISMAFRNTNPRLRVLGGLIGLGLGVLLVGMAGIQVVGAAVWSNREQVQSLRRVRLPSVRGDIVDRNGVVLANNRPSYDVVMYLDQLARVSKQRDIMPIVRQKVQHLSSTMGLPVTLTDDDVRRHYIQRRVLPLVIWRDLTAEQVARFAERATRETGADLMVTAVREYPLGATAAHVLGYTHRAVIADDQEDVFLYAQPDSAGATGIEKVYDAWLRGAPGARTIRVNPAGMTVEEVAFQPAALGQKLVMTLDTRLQQAVEQALAQAGPLHHGAAVALDPRNGEVLALASLPAFDPNIFNRGLTASAVNAVLQDEVNHPMINRAVSGRYAPGSTFKPVSLLAALEAGVVSLQHDVPVTCRGSIQIGSWHRPFRCWKHNGHGTVDLLQAMRQSCDIWFYERGLATGADRIAAMAAQLGLGQRTGIDLDHEIAGRVPTPAWKQDKQQERWWDGDTAQFAIGQSFLMTTPLQMACMAATIGNGGTRWRPHLVREIQTTAGHVLRRAQPTQLGRLTVTRANLETVRRTMLAAVMDSNGTGQRAAVKGVTVAGKTGTAEFDTYQNGVLRRINRCWFIGFAPHEDPVVALAVVLEEGESGGHTAAPVAGKILAAFFGKEVERVHGGGGD